MCRWFAYISPSEESPAHAISKQVNHHYLPYLLSHDPKVHAGTTTQAEVAIRNDLFNVDGFGMSWYTPTKSQFTPSTPSTVTSGPILHPAVYKITHPALHTTNFQTICAATATTCVMAHIRAASTGVVAEVNTHPFVFGRHTIMHNGYISSYPAIARQMAGLMSDEAHTHMTGRTDSEALAALYMTYLTSGAGHGTGQEAWERAYSPTEMKAALQNTISTIIELQRTALGQDVEPNDLNICVSDGRQLVASRFRNHETEQPPSLYHSASAGVTLNRKYPDEADGAGGKWGKGKGEMGTHGVKAEGRNPRAKKEVEEHGKHVIVASEPTTYKKVEWELIEKNHAIVVDGEGEVEFVEVTYPVGRRSSAQGLVLKGGADQ
ncbi:hypothetical protein VE03_05355 [Pseudogymnoascus sp. 23342-1-I1]|nr:hypothetical protein VE03_05355 [Pseudogymnoascus sp. 23342-1-I1]